MSSYPRGMEFPNEGFVQRAIESYFTAEGFTIRAGELADLVCVAESGQTRWVIEAKGASASIGLDFRTGLGQILSKMAERSVNYALAVPDIPQFAALCGQISGWVRKSLRLHWIFVNEDGSVGIFPPNSD